MQREAIEIIQIGIYNLIIEMCVEIVLQRFIVLFLHSIFRQAERTFYKYIFYKV